MTVDEFLIDIQKLKHKPKNPGGMTIQEAMCAGTHIWNESAVIGYVRNAMVRAGLDPKTAANVESELCALFNEMTVDEAEQSAKLWSYEDLTEDNSQ